MVPLDGQYCGRACCNAHFLSEGCVVALNFSAVPFSICDCLCTLRNTLTRSPVAAFASSNLKSREPDWR